jgi:type II secretory pathway pseudopilin PulG
MLTGPGGAAPAVHRDGEAGITLVEMLVAIVLFAIVGTMVTNGLVRGMQATRQTQDRVTALADLQKGTERMGRELRAGVPVEVTGGLGGFTATVDVRRQSKRYRHAYQVLDAGVGAGGQPVGRLDVTVSVFDPSSSTTPVSVTTTTLLRDLVNRPSDPSTAPFTYYRRGSTTPEVAPALPFATIDRVEVALQRRLPEQGPIALRSAITIRNASLS